jgi:hypothetical protein
MGCWLVVSGKTSLLDVDQTRECCSTILLSNRPIRCACRLLGLSSGRFDQFCAQSIRLDRPLHDFIGKKTLGTS